MSDFEDIRKVLRLAAQHRIDTPGFAFAALRRIEEGRPDHDAEIIVRELADSQPAYVGNDGEICCALCYTPEPIDRAGFHEPSCLWRRAKELYP